jgi:glycosyltransferase involved in cell wall biosynthesis
LFNKGAYIEKTILSVIAQTMTDWEMIVVDDGSTDGSTDIVRRYAAKDGRIRLHERVNARGPGSARNHGIALSTGNWVLFLDADDLMESTHLENLAGEARRHPSAKIVAGWYQRFNDKEPDVLVQIPPAGLGKSHQALLDFAIAFGPWAPHAAIVSRDVLLGQFLWDEKDFFGEDTAFWFRLLCFYKPGFCDNRGALYRYQSADCRTNSQSAAWRRGHHVQVMQNLTFMERNQLPVTSGQCDNLMRIYLNFYDLAVKSGDSETAAWSMQEAKRWLDDYFKCPGRHSLKMRIRKFAGLARIQACLAYLKRK